MINRKEIDQRTLFFYIENINSLPLQRLRTKPERLETARRYAKIFLKVGVGIKLHS